MLTSLLHVKGIGPATAEKLVAAGIPSAEALAEASLDELSAVPGFGDFRAGQIIAHARQLIDDTGEGKNKKSPSGEASPAKNEKDKAIMQKAKSKKKAKKKKKIDKNKKAEKKQGKREKKKKEKLTKDKAKKGKGKKSGSKKKAKKKKK